MSDLSSRLIILHVVQILAYQDGLDGSQRCHLRLIASHLPSIYKTELGFMEQFTTDE